MGRKKYKGQSDPNGAQLLMDMTDLSGPADAATAADAHRRSQAPVIIEEPTSLGRALFVTVGGMKPLPYFAGGIGRQGAGWGLWRSP